MHGGKIALWVRRRRHRLGFGVHSPFAFTLVRDVVRGKHCRYYRSQRLRFESRGLPRSIKRECAMLFRLAARHHFSEAIITPTVEPQLRGAILLAAPTTRFTTDFSSGNLSPLLLIANSSDLSSENINSVMAKGNIIYLRQTHAAPGLISEIISKMPGGWILHDRKAAMLIPDPSTPLCRIEVKLA